MSNESAYLRYAPICSLERVSLFYGSRFRALGFGLLMYSTCFYFLIFALEKELAAWTKFCLCILNGLGMLRDGIKVQLYQIIFVFDFKGKKLLRNADAIRLLDENCLALFCVLGSVLSSKVTCK